MAAGQQDKQENQNALAAIKIVEYKNLLTGRFLFIAGMRMFGALAGWWVYELTGDEAAIGFIGLSEVVPAVLMALYSGHRVDISEKRKLLLRCAMGYWSIVFVILSLAVLLNSKVLSKNHVLIGLYSLIFVSGIVRSFMGPTFSALIAAIVPKNILPNAIVWSQSTWLVASVIGHAAAGFMIYFFGVAGSLGGICLMILLGVIFFRKIKPKPILNTPGAITTWESVKEGLRFVYKTKELLSTMSLDMFAVLFGGVVALVPVFAKDILKVDAIGFGLLSAATDLGGMITVITLIIFPLKKSQGKKMLMAVAGFGICIILFAWSKWFIVSFFILMLCGMLDGISVVIRGTIMQLKTPDNMRGRVSSVSSIFINSSNELGQFESGMAAKLMGVVPSVVFGGCMTLAVVVTTWFSALKLRRLEY